MYKLVLLEEHQNNGHQDNPYFEPGRLTIHQKMWYMYSTHSKSLQFQMQLMDKYLQDMMRFPLLDRYLNKLTILIRQRD